MNDEVFRKTEERLYDYFEQPQQVENLKNHVALLKEQVQELEERIQYNKVNIEPGLNMGIDYSKDKIQVSSQGSYVENELCRQVKKLIDRKNRKIGEMNEMLNQIDDINESNKIIHDNLKDLNEECKQFIKYKYKEKLCLLDMLYKLHMSRSAWFDKRKKLIENIAQWFIFTKT